MIVVEVRSVDGATWDEVSRHDPALRYTSTRHTPPKSLTGYEIAQEDKQRFQNITGYGRETRIRDLTPP